MVKFACSCAPRRSAIHRQGVYDDQRALRQNSLQAEENVATQLLGPVHRAYERRALRLSGGHGTATSICIHEFRMVLLKQRVAGVAQLVERNLAKV